jgi:spermidine/putrescine transport system substrate-binding protein
MATGDELMSGLDHLDALRLTRRAALSRGAGGVAAATGLSALLAACGSSSSTTSSAAATAPSSSSTTSAAAQTGTVTLLTYPQWYGPNEFSDFQKLHPGVNIKTAVSGTTGQAAQITQIETNPGAFDLTLAGVPVSSQMKLANLLEPLDTSAVPNVSLTGAPFRAAFPFGIPTDFGKTGYAYRSDLITERPTTWKELWTTLAQKYSGKITMIKYDSDIQGTALRYLGYSINTKDQAQLQAMQQALLQLKPHLQAILETDYSKALIEGTAVIAIDYDYDIAAAQQKNKHIVWVPPAEGMSAYLEGWIALKGSHHLPLVWELMNFHLEPKNYASFVNATGTAYVEKAAEPYIMKSISANPSLRYDPAQLAKVEFEQYLGPEQTAYRGKLWEEFLAA